MRRLEREAEQGMISFELANGRRYYFDPEEASKSTFLFFADSMTADYKREPRPEPPDLLKPWPMPETGGMPCLASWAASLTCQ